jgi:ribosomal protein L40E
MITPIGIILGLVAVILIGYPLFKPRAKDFPGDEALEDEIERQIRELRQGCSEASEGVVKSICASCGARYNPGDKFCSECGASLTS